MLVKIVAIGPWLGVLRLLTISLKRRNGIHVNMIRNRNCVKAYSLIELLAEPYNSVTRKRTVAVAADNWGYDF